MNSKGSQNDINSQTVKHFIQLLDNNRATILTDRKAQTELSKLKNYLIKLEDSNWEYRAKKAAKKLSELTEEDRRLLLMWPEEKAFFLAYKKKNPQDPWSYFKEYQKKVRDDFKSKKKISKKRISSFV